MRNQDKRWIGYAYMEYDKEGIFRELQLGVMEMHNNHIPMLLSYRAIFIVDLASGKIKKDRYARRIGEKATTFELELFRNLADQKIRLMGAGI